MGALMLNRLLMIVALTTALLFGFCGQAAAQTITQYQGNASTSDPAQGQSFTATVTGTWTELQVRARFASDATLHVYAGAGSGVDGEVGEPIFSQEVSLQAFENGGPGVQTIILDQAVPIEAGEVYSFSLEGSFLSLWLDDIYPGGSYISNFNTQDPSADLVFGIVQEPVAIPTLSEWAMILLAMSLAVAGYVVLSQRRWV